MGTGLGARRSAPDGCRVVQPPAGWRRHAARDPRADRDVPGRPLYPALIMNSASCRFCAAPLETVFADLGMSPLANSYLAPEHTGAMERFYPLCAHVCGECLLVQLEEFETAEAAFSVS